METHFFSAMSQWFMYFLPTIVAWFRRRQGNSIVLPFGLFFLLNLTLAWTVVVWLLLMANALGFNPVPWVVFKLAKFLPSGPPMGAPQAAQDSSAMGHTCGQCGGSGTMMCSQCQGHGSWYTQPTSAHEVAQLQTCGHCLSSGRIRCPYCLGSRV